MTHIGAAPHAASEVTRTVVLELSASWPKESSIGVSCPALQLKMVYTELLDGWARRGQDNRRQCITQ